MRAKRIAGLGALVCALALVAGAGGTTTPLPGGTSLDVTITSPSDGATLPLAPVTVTGTAAVGTGAPVANTTLIYIVDVSGSTYEPTGAANAGKCPRQNVYDTAPDTTLDCELLAIRDLNAAAIATGTVAKIGLIAFAGTGTDTLTNITSAAALDLLPGTGVTTLTAPDANDFVAPPTMTRVFTPATNLDWVVQGAYLNTLPTAPTVGWPARGPSDGFTLFSPHDVGQSTNYTAALYALKSLIPSVTTSNTVVAFLSDGLPNQTVAGQAMGTVLSMLPTTNFTIDTFAVGASASCGTATATLDGSLAQISAHYGKTCQVLHDASDAVDLVPDVVASKLSSVTVSVDGGAAIPVTPTAPAVLPVNGPATVPWTLTLPSGLLTPGAPHQICATATGSDGGGAGTARDCVTVTVKAPPTVTVGDGSGSAGTTDEGTAFPVSAIASDGTTTWAISTGPCAFADAGSPSTTVTCYDNGTYTLLFRATDGINPPVFGSETLTVRNVAPTPTLTLSPGGPYALGSPVTADVSIVDPGTLDTETCSIDWGDGTTSTVFVGTLRECTAPHTYATAGSFTVTVSVTDKDGGIGTDSKTLVVNAPPDVHVSDASGYEGSAIPLTATATDPENDPLQYTWTATPLSGVDPAAACTFSSPVAPSPSITCNDNGTWTITLTVSDGVNQPVSASGTLTVQNVAPHPTLTFSAGPHAVGSTLTANVSIADPGAIDTFGCTFEWGDGTPTTTVAATGSSCSAPHAYAAYGSYHVTVTVVDKDGGTGLDTQIVVVDGPPVVRVSDASGNEGSAIPLSATATDPEGDPLTYAWTATPGAGVDAGAACTFASPSSLATTVKCTDDGTWTLTLVASDGINTGVTTTGTLTVANVAPSVTITSPAAGSSSRSVSFSAGVTDPGSNDVLSCSINWGDGTAAQTVAVAGGVCATTHTYATSVASATITVTASDDDGGTATATRALSFNRPPMCSAVKAVPDELWPPDGDLKLVTLVGAYDPDGGPVTYTITGVTQNEQLGGWDGHDDAWYEKGHRKRPPDAVILHGPYLLLRAWRDPHGGGRIYTIAFTVTDSQGATCSGTTTVEVPHDRGHHPKHDKHDDDYDSFGRR